MGRNRTHYRSQQCGEQKARDQRIEEQIRQHDENSLRILHCHSIAFDIGKLLAQAAGATGRKAQRHTAMSWFYYTNGFTRQAIEQLQLAEKSPGLGHYETSRIQARIKEYQQLLQAENMQ